MQQTGAAAPAPGKGSAPAGLRHKNNHQGRPQEEEEGGSNSPTIEATSDDELLQDPREQVEGRLEEVEKVCGPGTGSAALRAFISGSLHTIVVAVPRTRRPASKPQEGGLPK